MAELGAALLLVVGSIVILLAAIGVARFPDAFMRMHAATKAGVIGTGLCMLGVAFGFGDQATWVKVTLIVAFLLVTTPIASHVLGRSAWRASAHIVPHTRLASIEPEMPRVDFDVFPEFSLSRRRDTKPIQRQEVTVLDIQMKKLERREPAVAHIPMAAALDEVLLAVAWHSEGESAGAFAAALACAGGARLTILSIVDSMLIDAPTAVPVGGAHYARRVVRTRLAQARDRAASSARVAAKQAATMGLLPVVRHVEGKPSPGHFACDRRHSVIVMPAGCWFDHGVTLDENKAAAAPAGVGRNAAADAARGVAALRAAAGPARWE